MTKDRKKHRGVDLGKLGRSFAAAASGFGQALRTEQNMQIHLVITVAVVAAGLWLEISGNEWLMLAACIIGVLVVELLNTALEYLADVVRDEGKLNYEATKYPRDMAAAAVLLTAMTAAAVGLMIFVPHFVNKMGW